jgi:hypothetical protein
MGGPRDKKAFAVGDHAIMTLADVAGGEAALPWLRSRERGGGREEGGGRAVGELDGEELRCGLRCSVFRESGCGGLVCCRQQLSNHTDGNLSVWTLAGLDAEEDGESGAASGVQIDDDALVGKGPGRHWELKLEGECCAAVVIHLHVDLGAVVGFVEMLSEALLQVQPCVVCDIASERTNSAWWLRSNREGRGAGGGKGGCQSAGHCSWSKKLLFSELLSGFSSISLRDLACRLAVEMGPRDVGDILRRWARSTGM